MKREHYPTDLSDKQWAILEPLIPPAKTGGRPRKTDMREVVNAIIYVLRSGGAWRLLPHDFPRWQTVYGYFRAWRDMGMWETIHTILRERLRRKVGRKATPSAGILDSQSVKVTTQGGFRGYDGAKKVNGRKRHVLVDTQGLVMQVVVSPADVRDTEGAEALLDRMAGRFPRLQHIWVDGGYRGKFIKWVHQQFKITVEVVQHWWSEMKRGVWLPADAPPPVIPTGFHVLPRRWVVERTFGRFGMYRRLSKDYEHHLHSSEALIYATMSHIMLRRLAK